MGVRESSSPLSYTLGGGQYTGFHVDMCQRIIDSIKTADAVRSRRRDRTRREGRSDRMPFPAPSESLEGREEHLAIRRTFRLARRARAIIVRDMAKHDPDLSRLFHALADPTRRSILRRLAEGPAPVTALANPTGLRLPTVMRHLSVLEEAGLIATSKDGRVRSCAIVPEALVPVRTWLDEQRDIWEARLDRLDDYVTKLMKEREK
jgi:DNA-binding transcriptional ArsR family regulator